MARSWRPVAGHPEYDVSDRGDVRSRKWSKNRTLKPSITPTGYHVVNLDGRTRSVHHLVLEAFVEPRPWPRAETRHLDGDPGNNRPENLGWGTRLENAADKRRHGTHNNTQRQTCRRLGHALEEPNLNAWHRAHGHRACFSCHWAGTIKAVARRNGREHDRDALAREMYAHLMEGAPDPRDRNLTGTGATHEKQPCGTHAAYQQHWLRGERACDPCLTAHREYDRRRRQAERQARPAPVPRTPVELPGEVREELRGLHEQARRVTGGTPKASTAWAVSEQLTARLAELRREGFTTSDLGSALGMRPKAVGLRLRRHGFRATGQPKAPDPLRS